MGDEEVRIKEGSEGAEVKRASVLLGRLGEAGMIECIGVHMASMTSGGVGEGDHV